VKWKTLFILVAVSSASASFDPKDLWKNIRTYQAKFTQEVYSKTVPSDKPDTTQGTIYLQRPDHLRWETQGENGSPEVQILAGDELKSIRKNRRGTTLVDIYSNVKNQPSAKPLNFLMGKEALTKIYKVKVKGETDSQVTLELISKASPKESYIAEIDKQGYFLLSLTTDTAESKVIMKFEHPKLNVGLKSDLFNYSPKPGDIVHRQ
jgi:outer membrane lipoprotein-sorting protein